MLAPREGQGRCGTKSGCDERSPLLKLVGPVFFPFSLFFLSCEEQFCFACVPTVIHHHRSKVVGLKEYVQKLKIVSQ